VIGAVILAAGQSRRMGRNKLLLPFGASTVIETIVSEVAACRAVGDIVVVTGYEREQVIVQLATYPVRCVFNPDYAQSDMLVSIQIGLRALSEDVAAVLIVLGDQPRLRREIVQRVVDAYEPGSLIVPSFQLRRGHPILIDRALWPAILARPPEATLRDVIRANELRIRYVVAADDSVLHDMDTPEDYEQVNR
jgi:molybdenum cofactor cytidylyltransferase